MLTTGVVIALIVLVTGVIIYNANNPALTTYESSAAYDAPKNESKVLDLSVTLQGDTIKDLALTDKMSTGEISTYQETFQIAAKDRVVGKSIKDQFDETAINGSSLTSTAFFQALKEIKSQAGM